MMIQNTPVLREGLLDTLSWNADKSGRFTVASAYKGCEPQSEVNVKLGEFIWKNVAPPKRERIKTACYLQRIEVLSETSNVNCIFLQE
ncbi:hypothetical protein ACSBR1_033997 [Camellia fascicularis]